MKVVVGIDVVVGVKMLLVIFIEGMNGLAASYDSVHAVFTSEAAFKVVP